ncbi:MAG TPA: hypothetical protein VHB93_01580 [Candidatus Paceibacterota bacterium]|nr:hypothetical protein [Candidatus Paceibacterota bacterium]
MKEKKMPICGYHPDMGNGLKQFAKGLSAAVLANAKKHGRSLAGQRAQEQDELAIHIAQLENRIDRSANGREVQAARAMRGIIDIARFMANNFDDPAIEKQLPDYVDAGAERLVALLKNFEDAIEARESESLVSRSRNAWREAVEQGK